MGQIQTETAYYQPSPDISSPFPPVAADNDPQGSQLCDSTKGNCDGWGLRIINSHDISVYGAGLYSFFNNYNTCKHPALLDASPHTSSLLTPH